MAKSPNRPYVSHQRAGSRLKFRDGAGLNPVQHGIFIMRSTQQLSITLPNQMAYAVEAKVAAGEHATESEVIRDGLRALMARNRALETGSSAR